MQSKATTVTQYLKELSADRRKPIETVRQIILENLDEGFKEGMQYGMIGYYVPHSIYPDGYHCDPKQPLPFACLASQKNYMSLYMMATYGQGVDDDWFRKEWAKTGKKLDMGKSCIRFKKTEELALDVIAQAIRRVSIREYIEHYERTIKGTMSRSRGKTTTKPKSTGRKSKSKSLKRARK